MAVGPVPLIARLWNAPPAMRVAPINPVDSLTRTGAERRVFVPSPSSPSSLFPQAQSVPPPASVRLWYAPVAMLVTPSRS